MSRPFDRNSSSDSPQSQDSPESPSVRLKRYLSLSTKPTVPASSNLAQKTAKSDVDQEDFRIIGLGSCGTVFEIPRTKLAYKKGSQLSAMWTDFCLTNKVHNAIDAVESRIRKMFPDLIIPQTPLCHEFHPPTDDEQFWDENLPHFPPDRRSRQPTFLVDRILPLPRPVREALSEEYFDPNEAIQREAKENTDNQDCLIRIYLGSSESEAEKARAYDSLRNFPLKLNMLQHLSLDTQTIAAEMALDLAILHWEAQVRRYGCGIRA